MLNDFLCPIKPAMVTARVKKCTLPTAHWFAGKIQSPFVAPYTATKFALNGFFGSLFHELAMKRSNVSVSICTLGLIDTEAAMQKVK